MAPLKSARKERFCLALSEGKSATQAYAEAGYSPNGPNAARLTKKDDVRQRLAELQAGAAKSSAVTVESIMLELDDAIAVARSKHQAQAMVSASSMKAKLAGLMTERIEVGPPGSFDDSATPAQIMDRTVDDLLAESIQRFAPVCLADREHLAELLLRFFDTLNGYIAEVDARPHAAERVDPRHLAADWQDIPKRDALASYRRTRIINGTAKHTEPPMREVRKLSAED